MVDRDRLEERIGGRQRLRTDRSQLHVGPERQPQDSGHVDFRSGTLHEQSVVEINAKRPGAQLIADRQPLFFQRRQRGHFMFDDLS